MKHIHLHIDRLVLHGMRPEERHEFATGLQRELMRVLSDPQAAGQLTAHGDVSRLSVGGLTIRHDSTPRQIGTGVARSIGRRMKR